MTRQRSKLAVARFRAHLTTIEMAEHLGVHRTTYSRWEKGPEFIPAERFPELAEILGVTPKYLMLPNGATVEDYLALEKAA